MKKKIILVVIVVFAVAVSGVFVLTKCLKTNSNHEQVNVVEEKDEEFNLQEEEQSKDEITTETDEIENKTANGKSESPKEDTSKQENKSKTSTKVSETPKKAETKSSNVPTISSKSQEEKQEEFKDKINDSQYIEFKQGGPYTTSGLDFYITKLQSHNYIRFNDYYNASDRAIYLAGNLGEFYIKTEDKDIPLKTYISTTYQTLDDIIKSISNKLESKSTYKDGGTKIYKSKDKDITMIVCNTIEGNKEILIGD